MSLREALYEATLALARPLLRATSPLHPKLRRGVRGRQASLDRLVGWAGAYRDEARPLVWLHAPSAGEALMAKAIVAALRERRPDAQILFTHFSPSAERVADQVGADVHGYVPWDVRRDVRQCIDALRPSVIAFVRTEVWPVLAREAAARGVRLALVNAVLAPTSSRGRGLTRLLLEPVYRRLDALGAVSALDAERYRGLGVRDRALHVTGDARFDQVWARIDAQQLLEWRERVLGHDRGGAPPSSVGQVRFHDGERDPAPALGILRTLRKPGALTIVAGSTWAADEKALVPPFAVAQRQLPVRLIIAPHEPGEAQLGNLERRIDRQGLQHARLSALMAAGGPAPDVVVVDRLGVLAEVYAIAGIAYVGGGFGPSGVHSIVEPAAMGVPVMFGPGHENAREAAELVAAGGGFVVDGPGRIKELIVALARDPDRRDRTGAAAREYGRSQLGGGAANAELVLSLLDGT